MRSRSALLSPALHRWGCVHLFLHAVVQQRRRKETHTQPRTRLRVPLHLRRLWQPRLPIPHTQRRRLQLCRAAAARAPPPRLFSELARAPPEWHQRRRRALFHKKERRAPRLTILLQCCPRESRCCRCNKTIAHCAEYRSRKPRNDHQLESCQNVL